MGFRQYIYMSLLQLGSNLMNLLVQSYRFSAILLIWSTKLINNTNRAGGGVGTWRRVEKGGEWEENGGEGRGKGRGKGSGI